jgi:hypothetical protein
MKKKTIAFGFLALSSLLMIASCSKKKQNKKDTTTSTSEVIQDTTTSTDTSTSTTEGVVDNEYNVSYVYNGKSFNTKTVDGKITDLKTDNYIEEDELFVSEYEVNGYKIKNTDTFVEDGTEIDSDLELEIVTTLVDKQFNPLTEQQVDVLNRYEEIREYLLSPFYDLESYNNISQMLMYGKNGDNYLNDYVEMRSTGPYFPYGNSLFTSLEQLNHIYLSSLNNITGLLYNKDGFVITTTVSGDKTEYFSEKLPFMNSIKFNQDASGNYTSYINVAYGSYGVELDGEEIEDLVDNFEVPDFGVVRIVGRVLDDGYYTSSATGSYDQEKAAEYTAGDKDLFDYVYGSLFIVNMIDENTLVLKNSDSYTCLYTDGDRATFNLDGSLRKYYNNGMIFECDYFAVPTILRSLPSLDGPFVEKIEESSLDELISNFDIEDLPENYYVRYSNYVTGELNVNYVIPVNQILLDSFSELDKYFPYGIRGVIQFYLQCGIEDNGIRYSKKDNAYAVEFEYKLNDNDDPLTVLFVFDKLGKVIYIEETDNYDEFVDEYDIYYDYEMDSLR